MIFLAEHGYMPALHPDEKRKLLIGSNLVSYVVKLSR